MFVHIVMSFFYFKNSLFSPNAFEVSFERNVLTKCF